MGTDLDIAAVNVVTRTALATDDRVCTITNLFDADGDETDEPDEACTAVVHYDDDNWFVVRLDAFSKVLDG